MSHMNNRQIGELLHKLQEWGFVTTHSEESPDLDKKKKKEKDLRPRKGKTQKDVESGAKQRNHENKQARVAWQEQCRGNKLREQSFPITSCNGKKNRHRVTGKGNTTIILKG